jgi:hypothetical protein
MSKFEMSVKLYRAGIPFRELKPIPLTGKHSSRKNNGRSQYKNWKNGY